MSTFIRPAQSPLAKYLDVGTQVRSRGTFFRIWAPHAFSVHLVIEDHAVQHELQRVSGDYFETFVEGAKTGDRYHYALDGERLLPDPGSRFQPFGVHGPSQIVDPNAYHWHDNSWQGVSQKELVIYELHVGTFTTEGTFGALETKLGYLRDLGVNAIELMPIAEFAGRWNWGYDPAALFAPSHRYGTPDDLPDLSIRRINMVSQCY